MELNSNFSLVLRNSYFVNQRGLTQIFLNLTGLP